MIQAVIIDDEYLAVEELAFLLSQLDTIRVVGKADCGLDGLTIIQELKPDLAFVDVRMPDMTGIQLSKEINRLNIKCKIIFVTAYDQYAVEAFGVDAIDYILKPYEEERVAKAVAKAKAMIEGQSTPAAKPAVSTAIDRLPAMKGDKLVLVDMKDILMIYTEDRNIYIKTAKETYVSNHSLQELEDRLNDKSFFRTHRSYLVNLNKITEVSPWFNGSYVAYVEGLPDEIPISRNYLKQFKQILGI